MNIENDIFKRMQVNFKSLLDYGFNKDNDLYIYSKEIMNNNFKVTVIVNKNGNVTGNIFDLEVNEEYTNFRIENQVGEFVSTVREEYIKILEDIAKNCFTKKYFISEQANRISKLIYEKFGDIGEFPWGEESDGCVFRNPNNRKWYALVMNVSRNKITNGDGEVEILNVKLDDEEIKSLIKQNGYYTCYHMNKNKWITIILDDTLTDEIIMDHITESHNYTVSPKEWLIPANPKYYDCVNCFNEQDTILWKQSTDINIGDTVYMYVASPYSAIFYKCEVLEANIPYNYSDSNLSISRVMKIKLLNKYNPNKYTFDYLKEYGIKSIRGPRYMPKKLSDEINIKKILVSKDNTN